MSINKIDDEKSQNNQQLIKKGFDLNLVINKNYLNSLDNIYKCCICEKIMINPVECESCGHNFCYNCLSSKGCPFGCKQLKINEATLSIYNILNNIKFKCENIGCTEILTYSEVENHTNECPYKKMKCNNEGCDKIILIKDILNHNKNECEFFKIKCIFCKNEFIKKEIESHEKKCELIYKENKEKNNDNEFITLEEHLKRLLMNLNEIIKDNKKLVEKFNESNNNEDLIPTRISIRKSIVGGLEGDEFFDIIKEDFENKIKKYYSDFINNYQNILKEIEELKPLLNDYIKENKIREQSEKEEIKNYLNNLFATIEIDLKNILSNFNEKFSSEFTLVNNLFENKAENLNKTNKNKKDIYSLINIMFNNLGKFLFEENDKIKLISNDFFKKLNNLFIIYNKNKDVNETIKKIDNNKNIINNIEKDEININNNNINQTIDENLLEKRKLILKNVNLDLNELKNNIKKTINIINEKFIDFSDIINYNNLKNAYKLKYEVCPISSFSLFKSKIPDNIFVVDEEKDNSEDINKNNDELIYLNNIESRLTNIENESKKIYSQMKEKINSEISNKLNEININIEKDIDKKIDLMFTLKICKECEKIDYKYGFTKCRICSKEICKQCTLLCSSCKNFCCLKCCNCKKCGKNICKNCRIQCILCNENYCHSCLTNCPQCKNKVCSNCFSQKCSLCKENNFCFKYSKKCQLCNINFCFKCIKNNKFIQCYLCNKYACDNCYKICIDNNNNSICKTCCNECNICNENFCTNNINSCNKCNKKFCNKCSENYMKNNNCKLCKCIFCKDCFNENKTILKCFYCNKKPCFNCSIKCTNCSNNCCKECSSLCKICNKSSCIKCLYECICGKNFCIKCIGKNETIFPHECIYFLNNCAVTDSKKIYSLKMIPNNLNIEAKFSVLMNDISDKSFLLIGIIDKEENGNIFAVNVNNGNKFSSSKGFESFFDFDDIKKGTNFIYVMIKENKLFFKVNESIYKWAFDLNKTSSFWFYVENNIDEAATKFLFLRKIK